MVENLSKTYNLEKNMMDMADPSESSSNSVLLPEERPGSSLSNISGFSSVTNTALFSQAALSQRIVNVEYYMTAPVKEFDNLYSDFRGSAVKKVPVIRIFGASPAGQKVCANIHGVFPYITIPADDTVDDLEQKMAVALDKAINDSVNTNTSKFARGNQSYKDAAQHVFKVVRISGKTFYGYRSAKEYFLRIFFYNPLMLRKAVDVLNSGNVLGRRFQPHEAHIPYSLQFMIDYCLYGMNYVHYSSVKFRRSSPIDSVKYSDEVRPLSQGSNSSLPGYIDLENVSESLLGPSHISKLTLCELEVDVLASDIILETKASEKAVSVNPGIDCIWKDEIERRRLQGIENCSQITVPESQERSQAAVRHSTEERYIETLLGKLHSFFETTTYEDECLSSQSIMNSSTVNEDEVHPSSQVLNHLSGEEALSQNDKTLNNELTQDQDDFLKLLEKMCEGTVSEISESGSKEEVPFLENMALGNDDFEEYNEKEFEEENEAENLWETSLLNALELVPDPESNIDNGLPPPASTIPQCDGQGGDSDSSAEDNSASDVAKKKKRGRRPRTMSDIVRLKNKVSTTAGSSSHSQESQQQQQSKSKPKNISQETRTHKNSPSHPSRLSITLRRKSRSQEVKSESQKSGTVPQSKASKVTAHRRSRSMSADREKLKAGRKKQLATPSKEKKVVELAKPVTRKSLSNPSPSKDTEKKNTERIAQKLPIVSTRTTRKAVNEAPTSSVQTKTKALREMIPCVYLTKVDKQKAIEALTRDAPKRTRRKPKRFLDDESTSASLSQEESLSEGSEIDKVAAPPVVENSTTEQVKRRARKDGEIKTQVPASTVLKANESKVLSAKVNRRKKKSVTDSSTPVNNTSGLGEVNVEKSEETSEGQFLKDGEDNRDDSTKSCQPKKIAKRKGKKKLRRVVVVSSEAGVTNGSASHESNKELNLTNESSNIANDGSTERQTVQNKDDSDAVASKSVPETLNSNDEDSVQSPHVKIQAVDNELQYESKDDMVVESNIKPEKVKPTSEASSGVAETPSIQASDSRPLKRKKKKRRLGMGISRAVKSATKSENLEQSSYVEKIQETTSIPVVENQITSGIDEEIMKSEPLQQVENNKDDINVKHYLDFGVNCKPESDSVMSQTEKTPIETKDVETIAKPVTSEMRSQTYIESINRGTQTNNVKRMVSIETQTDAVVPLCLCQCTCVTKDKSDASVAVQDDLKPVMESKRIQVDNVDMITQARAYKFTTPQGNRVKHTTTPSRSPEKRRIPQSHSPIRRTISSGSAHSRYLSALTKTPTSHQKFRSFARESSSSPNIPTCSPHGGKATPPSREDYLIHSIQVAAAASVSPKKRTSSIRPRNLDNEIAIKLSSKSKGHDGKPLKSGMHEASTSSEMDSSNESTTPTTNHNEVQGFPESPENVDLSVNSIYEYEEPSLETTDNMSMMVASPTVNSEEEEESPATLSAFQRKRLQSKHRSRNRLEKKRVANLDANREIPDIFEIEYEPLKQPASFKSTVKWLVAEKNQKYRAPVTSRDTIDESYGNDGDGNSSDEESLPPPVKLFGGGNLSDEDNSDSEEPSSSLVVSDKRAETLKPFTPPAQLVDLFMKENKATPGSGGYSNETPRSILRQSGSSRRSNGRVMKRKIRWEDEEPCKRIKTEWDHVNVKQENEDCSQSSIEKFTLDKTMDSSEIDGPSFKNALGLENSMSNFQDVKALHQCQFLTTMYVEVHCSSRDSLLPDPEHDSVLAIFALISNDYPESFRKPKECLHVLLLDEKAATVTPAQNVCSSSCKAYSNEENLFDAFIGLVRHWDPDIFVGYEIEKASLGYLIQRASFLGKQLTQELSRVVPVVTKGVKDYRDSGEWNGTIGGRIVLNLWRLLRHEISVQSYTFENATYHILLRRECKFSQKTLREYWSHKMSRHKVITYYTIRVQGAMRILEKLDLINRTSELARLFGIQFYEVLSRGSQFRVESMMLRATKPLDFIAPSPSVTQRARMRAPEYLPLILEPKSNYYTDPVAVLDFQSLYPSMMIAYNYDYASLLGRVEHLGNLERFPVGCLDHAVSPGDLLRLKDHIHVSPAGVAFLDKSVVKGILPEMLEQILETRQMVKRAMKKWKAEGASLQKVLDSRQLGLKLIANVTYGYTSANFSGRMPCVEVADSIVSKGRETLQRAINHVKENYNRWGAEVVYGDTDSMFVLFRGRSRNEAFKLAYEIADEVTQANPKPVKLKFEKIYQPCILQSKKRYVGYAYETPEQVKPVYDAKGIETVRRDGCPAVRKILEKTLHILFTYNKREKVERYVKLQFEKLFKGRVSMQDYIFAREFRGRAGYKPTASVPSLEIAKRLVQIDPRSEPLVSERVQYVVVYGNPTLPLIKLVRTPQEYLENSGLRLNAHYYIEKVIIPALNRCLMHAKVNALEWYKELPRKFLRNVLDQKTKGQGTLDDYILHQNCLRCDEKAEDGLCYKCKADGSETIIHLQEVVRNSNSKLKSCVEICMSCAKEKDTCVNVDCGVLHKLTRYQRDQAHVKKLEQELARLEW